MKISIFCLLLILCLTFLPLSAPPAQVKIVPGSVVRGAQILEDNACLNCHALNGRGGSRAPDFASLSGRDSKPAQLAATMWNHNPQMWAEFQTTRQDLPPLTSFEVADLFAWFYATLYFGPAGDANRGLTVFQQKNCSNCHSAVLDTRSPNPAADRWTGLGPITWAERMWNHANEMDSATTNRGLPWPVLSEQDIADLMAFVSSRPSSNQRPVLEIGEPERGHLVFERSCESCHSFGRIDRSRVDLLSRAGPSSITGYIAAMWNHAPQMRRRGGSVPQLNSGEMPDLVAFLFSERYFFEQGDAVRGSRVHEAKGCTTCHETRRRETGAPELAQSTEVFSPITITSAMWRHGPSMLASMKQMGVSWPSFQGSEMADLIAYLNSRLVMRIGQPFPGR